MPGTVRAVLANQFLNASKDAIGFAAGGIGDVARPKHACRCGKFVTSTIKAGSSTRKLDTTNCISSIVVGNSSL
jgi:hypothetical protein